MYMLEGVSCVANFITAYEESQLNRDSHFLSCSVFIVSKGKLCKRLFYYTAAGDSAVWRR